MPRPEHPRKADAQTIVASKNKISIQEEKKVFLARHLKATEAGEFVTIDALFQAYKKELGRSYTRDAFYQLLKRHGWRNIMPRPEHPRKADAQTIVASKNKISIQEEKKAL
ncbi:transposase [Streptococcus pneumoniae]|nr:transposase [Streptococcus pneumoniae]